MEHLLLKAATTAATDEGVFEAVISTATIDREKDIVDPAGMVDALRRWVPTGKNIPLAWNHSGAPQDQIGYIDPASAKTVGNEVVVSGWIDQQTEVGAHAWRLVKMGTLGFSFGYLVPDGGATKRAGGGNQISELDVFEVTASPTPMNNDTRVLGWKADVPASQILNAMLGLAQKFIDSEDDADDIATMRGVATQLRKLGAAEVSEPDDSAQDGGKSARQLVDDELRKQSSQIERGLIAADLPEVPKGRSAGNLKTVVAAARGYADARPNDAAARDALDTLETLEASENEALRLFARLVSEDEMAGTKTGELKAVWSAAYVNALPDSAFLHVESGGSKDSEGKTTPRNLRHFPYKDADGSVDLPHLRNALARIPQSNLPSSVKDELTSKAQRILDAQKAVRSQEPTRAHAADPLRRTSEQAALEIQSGGASLRKSPTVTPKPQVQAPPEDDLRRQTRDLMLKVLTGTGVDDDAQRA